MDKSEVLLETLPYIRKYAGKTIVIKYGGNAMINEELKESVLDDIALLTSVGIKIVLVHGGGPEISEMLGELNIKSEFVDGLRVTSKEAADVAQMVLSGRISKELVKKLQNKGSRAVSLNGIDSGMIEATPVDKEHGYVGKIIKTDTSIIDILLDNNIIPVISSIGFDDDNNTYNINADSVASAIASSLKAESMLIMTDTAGILMDRNDESSLISKIYVSDAPELMDEGVISGGMIPKVNCCIEAIRNGVKRVFVIDGRKKHAIIMEMLTDAGLGTMFVE